MAYRFYTETSESKNNGNEKKIILMTISMILAIFFDGKRKKPKKRKNFIERTTKNYKSADSLVDSFSAYRKKKKFEKTGIKPKYNGTEIEKADIIDIGL